MIASSSSWISLSVSNQIARNWLLLHHYSQANWDHLSILDQSLYLVTFHNKLCTKWQQKERWWTLIVQNLFHQKSAWMIELLTGKWGLLYIIASARSTKHVICMAMQDPSIVHVFFCKMTDTRRKCACPTRYRTRHVLSNFYILPLR